MWSAVLDCSGFLLSRPIMPLASLITNKLISTHLKTYTYIYPYLLAGPRRRSQSRSTRSSPRCRSHRPSSTTKCMFRHYRGSPKRGARTWWSCPCYSRARGSCRGDEWTGRAVACGQTNWVTLSISCPTGSTGKNV